MNHATVLLVEDDPNDALLLGFAFRENSLALHLQQVCDGHAAIAYLQGEGRYSNRCAYPLPGLVVLDLHMPRVGGIAVLRWIRKQPWLVGLPVVVLGGNDSKTLDEAMASGAVMIKRRATKDLIHLLENVNLGWAANLEAAGKSVSNLGNEHPRRLTMQSPSHSRRVCGAVDSRSARSMRSDERNSVALNS